MKISTEAAQATYFHHALPAVELKILRKIAKHTDILQLWLNGKVQDYVNLGIDRHVANLIVREKAGFGTKHFSQRLEQAKIDLLTQNDAHFPTLLRHIHDPPALLYYQGDWQRFKDRRWLAIVGTRKMSHYGRAAVEKLIVGLAEAEVAIVSGGAFGIDKHVLECCLAFDIPCCAVLGSGLQKPTPTSNQALFRRMLAADCLLVSEYLPWQPATKYQFPQRNRLIAGFAELTIVIEAPKKSGALITADFAAEQNRDVAAIPGPINSPLWSGCNNLLKAGAHLITCSEDILGLLSNRPPP